MYNPAVLLKFAVRVLLLAITVVAVPTVALEVSLGFQGQRNYLLWSANFVLLVIAVAAAVLFAGLGLYRSWQTTRSYLV